MLCDRATGEPLELRDDKGLTENDRMMASSVFTMFTRRSRLKEPLMEYSCVLKVKSSQEPYARFSSLNCCMSV